ncbi:MAG TPA: hypothetical protein VLE73_00780 [Candidatus Saccharimonadales bacterium]|nr:hypothetical protein [Candidatus Saccharimonadales bacterium]
MKRVYQPYLEAGIAPTAEHPLAHALDFGVDAADFSKLWIDQTAARRQLQIAGLSGAILGVGAVEAFEEPPQKEDVKQTVAGFSGSGDSLSAVGGMLLPRRERRQTELSSAHKEVDRPQVLSNYEWPEARVNINKPVIVQRVGERQQRFGMTREEAYAAELDRSLRRGIWEQAKHGGHIVDGTVLGKTVLAVNALSMSYVVLQDIFATNESLYLNLLYGVVYTKNLFIEALVNKRYSGSSHIRERRWTLTLLEGAAFDRLAAAGVAYAMGKPIITAKKPKHL